MPSLCSMYRAAATCLWVCLFTTCARADVIVLPPRNVEWPADETGWRERKPDDQLPCFYVEFPTAYVKAGRPLAARVLLVNQTGRPITYSAADVAAWVRVCRPTGELIKPATAPPAGDTRRRTVEPREGTQIEVDLAHYGPPAMGAYLVEFRQPLGGGLDLVSPPAVTLVEDPQAARRFADEWWPDSRPTARAVAGLLATSPAFAQVFYGPRLSPNLADAREMEPGGWHPCALPNYRAPEVSRQHKAWRVTLRVVTLGMRGLELARVTDAVAERTRVLTGDFAVTPEQDFVDDLYRLAKQAGPSHAGRHASRFHKSFGRSQVYRAVEDAGELKDAAYVPFLIAAARYPDEITAYAAAYTLRMYAPSDPQAAAFLREFPPQTPDDPEVALTAAVVSCYHGDDAAWPAVKAALTDADAQRRRIAIEAVRDERLARKKGEFLPILRAALKDAEGETLTDVIRTLGRYPSREHLDLITPFRTHPLPIVRGEANDVADAMAKRLARRQTDAATGAGRIGQGVVRWQRPDRPSCSFTPR